eukprot:5838017-Prymnesium_polylepis.3
MPGWRHARRRRARRARPSRMVRPRLFRARSPLPSGSRNRAALGSSVAPRQAGWWQRALLPARWRHAGRGARDRRPPPQQAPPSPTAGSPPVAR